MLSADEQALLAKPVSELNLSVRARKCMIRLGINTIADLIRRTGDDLLECKNFGVTSLNEVREKLTVLEPEAPGGIGTLELESWGLDTCLSRANPSLSRRSAAPEEGIGCYGQVARLMRLALCGWRPRNRRITPRLALPEGRGE